MVGPTLWEYQALDRFFVDIAPLQETEYTGIPQVAAKLSEQCLGDSSIEPGFFYNRHQVPPRIVEHLLKARNGALFKWAAERYCLEPVIPRFPDGAVAGLHLNMKFARRLFPVEGQIVHDLTTIVVPEYHTEDAIAYHREKFFGDLMTNDVTFCVSESTAADVRTYYPMVPGPVLVSHLGVEWAHVDDRHQTENIDVENFVLVLGTLEPRKNVSDVLDLLAQRPQLARRYRFVFAGRPGWGGAFEHALESRGLTRLLETGRIMRAGFVSETTKYLLLKHAACVIYPSVYEGFGLPVAEALSLGTPIVTTASSSLPEVGRDFAQYFVPGDLASLDAAIEAGLRQGRIVRSRSGEPLSEWQAYFSWKRCYETIRDKLFEAAHCAPEAGPHVRH